MCVIDIMVAFKYFSYLYFVAVFHIISVIIKIKCLSHEFVALYLHECR
jgi:hypothetical protein